MVNVFLTVDTEVSPWTAHWDQSSLPQDFRRDIYGSTAAGEFGLPFQMDLLDEYGLKAVFFVEALFACVVGLDPLREIVQMVQDRGHEVQLHVHAEWLDRMTPSIVPGRTGYNLKDFSEDDQAVLIARGIENLRACGVRNLCAFRAGNYGADFDTLRALARTGILYDSSHNTCYLDSDCGLRTPELLLQPQKIDGVYEFPISFFRDWPGHYRHVQLRACSSREIENALRGAADRGWYSFVLVSHSFELIDRRKRSGKPAMPDRTVIRRFRRLCRFLAAHRDQFRAVGFSDVVPEAIPAAVPSRPLISGLHHTAWRFAEQVIKRSV